MKENVDKHIEIMLDKAMKRSALDSPSFDFTSNVMEQVEKLKNSTVTTYQPLISKPIWALILVGFIAFVTYIVLVNKPEASGWFNGFDLNTLNSDKLTSLIDGIHLSKIVVYGLGLFSLMLLIQIPILKKYFDRRIEFNEFL
jgi:hypothetical protein